MLKESKCVNVTQVAMSFERVNQTHFQLVRETVYSQHVHVDVTIFNFYKSVFHVSPDHENMHPFDVNY